MKRIAGTLGLVFAIVFLILALNMKIPEREINYYGVEKYVGGDAYNYQIEASLRGGEIAGAQITRAIYYGIAAILGVISIALLDSVSSDALQKKLSNISKEVSNISNNTNQLKESIKPQNASVPQNADANGIQATEEPASPEG